MLDEMEKSRPLSIWISANQIREFSSYQSLRDIVMYLISFCLAAFPLPLLFLKFPNALEHKP